MREKRKMSVKEVGLTQNGAAKLLATTNISIGRQERGENKRGPLTGGLEYLIVTWPKLSESDKVVVIEELKKMRPDDYNK